MHYNTDPVKPDEYVDWIRFHDNETYWNRIHKGIGRYDWARMDYLVNTLYADKNIVYCILGTPEWLAEDPNVPVHHPWMLQGANSLPPYQSGGVDPYGVSYNNGIDVWNEFVAALSSRYKGKIQAYEIWNEPQLLGYLDPWTQEMRDRLSRMIKRAGSTIKTQDPNALVIGPSIFVGTSGRVTRASAVCDSLASTQSPYGPWQNLDAMAVHIYPANGEGATEWRRQLDECRSIISARGGPSKTWITETNYNLLGTVLPTNDPAVQQLIEDTYAEAGGKYIFWYSYDRIPDLNGLDMRNYQDTGGPNSFWAGAVKATKGIVYPPTIDFTITSSHTDWTGDADTDTASATFSLKNNGAESISVTHNLQSLTPSSSVIPPGSTSNFTTQFVNNPPDGKVSVTFTANNGVVTLSKSASETIPEKPTPVPVPNISLQVVGTQGDWTGSSASDTMTFTFVVTNTSDSDGLTVTHNRAGLTPQSSSIGVGSSTTFTESITTLPSNSMYEVLFTGTASDSRFKQYSSSFNVSAKPVAPPIPPAPEFHQLHCSWTNHKNGGSYTTEHTVSGSASYPIANCEDQFSIEKPGSWVGGNDWYLESYRWDDGTTTMVSRPSPPPATKWPLTNLDKVDAVSGDTVNTSMYRSLIIMPDGGTLNVPETIDKGFQFAVLSYNSPITLNTGRVDATTTTIPVNTITVISKVI